MTTEQYNNMMHRNGRIFMLFGIIMMFLAPVTIWIVTGVAPNLAQLGAGVLTLSIIFLPGGLMEMLTYGPILGTGATYLAFVTGNLINLKVPCVMNSSEICGTKINTPENDVVATISVAFSSITTVVILSLGVIMLIPLTPVLQSPVLKPAFDWVIFALFGALGYKYFKGKLKIVIAPMVLVVVLGILIPDFVIKQTSILIFVVALVTILVARILFSKKVI